MSMSEETQGERFRFIPYRKHDILEMCLRDERLRGQEEKIRYLYRLLDCTFHYEFHHIVEKMKDAYASIDPDADTNHYDNGGAPCREKFFDLLEDLLEKANYEHVTDEDLKQALKESSLFNIRLRVNFDDFDEMKLFYRGVSTRQARIAGWMGFGSKTIDFINFDRVVTSASVRSINASMPDITMFGSTSLLKMFRNVPKADWKCCSPTPACRCVRLTRFLSAFRPGRRNCRRVKLSPPYFPGSFVGYWFGRTTERPAVNKLRSSRFWWVLRRSSAIFGNNSAVSKTAN